MTACSPSPPLRGRCLHQETEGGLNLSKSLGIRESAAPLQPPLCPFHGHLPLKGGDGCKWQGHIMSEIARTDDTPLISIAFGCRVNLNRTAVVTMLVKDEQRVTTTAAEAVVISRGFLLAMKGSGYLLCWDCYQFWAEKFYIVKSWFIRRFIEDNILAKS